MKVIVSTFAYAHSLELKAMIDSLDPGRHELTVYLHLHSQKPAVVAMCHELALRRNVRLFEWGENRGLAKSFNDTLLHGFGSGADYVVNANDDSLWGEGDLGRMIDFATDHPEYYAVQAVGEHSTQGRVEHSYSAVLFQRRILRDVGMFDENFVPAYFEDCDYGYRAALVGHRMGTCEQTSVYHLGSGTLEHDPVFREAHDALFIGNRDYYLRKWGGLPGQERYKTPFNVAWLTGYIDPTRRGRPYGEHDRGDLPQTA